MHAFLSGCLLLRHESLYGGQEEPRCWGWISPLTSPAHKPLTDPLWDSVSLTMEQQQDCHENQMN